MTSLISHTTIGCRNAYEPSEWWKPVLGNVDTEGDPNEPGHEECVIRDPRPTTGCCSSKSLTSTCPPNAFTSTLPRAKGTRDAEVDRLYTAGATQVATTAVSMDWAPAGSPWQTPRGTGSA